VKIVIEISNLKRRILENKIVFITIIINVIYWMIESILDKFLFQSNENLMQSLFFLEIHESWHRFLIFGFFIFIGLYSQKIITKRKKAEQKIIDLARFTSENPNPVLRISKSQVVYVNKIGQKLLNIYETSQIPDFLRGKNPYCIKKD